MHHQGADAGDKIIDPDASAASNACSTCCRCRPRRTSWGAIATVAQAAWLPFHDGSVKCAWRLHVQFGFDPFLPDADQIALSDARNSGHSDEKTAAAPAQEGLRLRDGPPLGPASGR